MRGSHPNVSVGAGNVNEASIFLLSFKKSLSLLSSSECTFFPPEVSHKHFCFSNELKIKLLEREGSSLREPKILCMKCWFFFLLFVSASDSLLPHLTTFVWCLALLHLGAGPGCWETRKSRRPWAPRQAAGVARGARAQALVTCPGPAAD